MLAEYCDHTTRTCLLCPHKCKISEGKTGICGVRQNDGTSIITLNYAKITSMASDPVEKKPLYHFFPGTRIFSIGTFGCNLKCPYCQNWQISQSSDRDYAMINPSDLIKSASESGATAIAYTYSEPIVWYEYVKNVAVAAHEKGIRNVMVSNGMINPDPLTELAPYIDAWNIDMKTSINATFSKYHGGKLDSVKDSIRYLSGKTHLEITSLIVTGINDSRDDFLGIVEFISNVDRNIPLHISRYFPAYKYTAESTNMDLMTEFYEIAREKLDYVYCGNISNKMLSSTRCPRCGTVVIERNHYKTKIKSLQNGNCVNCGNEIYGIFGG